MATVPELLDKLAILLADVAPTRASSADALNAAYMLRGLLPASTQLDTIGLERKLLAVAESIAALTAAASRHSSNDAAWPTWVGQVEAGCCALATCAELACRACAAEQLPAASAFRIAASSGLVFGPGQTVLLHLMGTDICQREPWVTAAAHAMCYAQLMAVAACLSLVTRAPNQPATAAAFASSTGRPAALLTWLRSMAHTMVGPSFTTDDRQPLSAAFLSILGIVLSSAPFDSHRGQLAADAALQWVAAEVLLTQCLPDAAARLRAELAAGLSHDTPSPTLLKILATAVTHGCLRPAVLQAVQQRLLAGGSVATVRAAVDMVAALPLPGSTDALKLDSGKPLVALLYACSTQVLAGVVAGLAEPLALQPSSNGGSSGSGGGSGNSSSGGAAVTTPVASSDDCQQAAWMLVALVPHLAAIVHPYADTLSEATPVPVWANLGFVCGNVAESLQLLGCLSQRPATPAQLTSWAEAATAGIRLQPALLQLDSKLRVLCRLEDGESQYGPSQLSWQLMQHLLARVPLSSKPSSAAEQARLATSLWQMHSVVARLSHWVTGQGIPAFPGTATGSRASLLAGLMSGLTRVFRAAEHAMAIALESCAEESSPEVGKLHMQALCAAHADALAALAAAACVTAAAGPQQADLPRLVVQVVLTSLPPISYWHDTAVALSLGANIEACATLLLREPTKWAQSVTRLLNLMDAAFTSPPLMVAFGGSGLLDVLLQMGGQLAASSDGDPEERVHALLDDCDSFIALLPDHALEILESDAAARMPDTLATELRQAAGSLRQQHQQVFNGPGPSASLADRAEQLCQLVQPTARLAGLLQQQLQLPETRQELLLVQGKAAAARSCAYLRCANVGGGGGPAAGQGIGSSRCSACRAVWYCGTACSHADWRAGHKRVCKLLAAERQAAKAAAAEVAAGQQHQENEV